jgi:MFS family permease
VFSSWLWHLTRWDCLFLCTYLVTHLGGTALVVQFVGVAMFSPMMLGALMAGRLRRGLSPRRVVVGCQLVLLPLSAAFAVLVATGNAEIWTVYPLELVVGIGMMVNMTAQRELLVRSAGRERGAHALSMDITGQCAASMLGPLIGGISISVAGLGAAFSLIVLLLVGSILVLTTVSKGQLPDAPSILAAEAEGVGGSPQSLRANLRHLLGNRELAFILGVTVFANLCCFCFMPLIPVVAQRLHAGALMAGVIGSASGAVQLVVCTALVARPVGRLTAGFVGGAALAMLCLAMLAYAPTVAVAVLVLGLLGLGQGVFSNVQTLLTVRSVPTENRAGALGLLTTTIGGAMPLGMVSLGLSSSVLGDQLGMLVLPVTGLGALAAVLRLTIWSPRAHPGVERAFASAPAVVSQRSNL